MSFLDRVTKAVGDAVDRGKKELDQFMQIQKINGQISECERKIAQHRTDIQQVKVDIGGHTLEMLRAGTLTSPELQALADKIGAIEQQITGEEAVIAQKKVEIEKIKAEDATQAATPPPVAASPVAEAPPPAPMTEAVPAPPPLPTPTGVEHTAEPQPVPPLPTAAEAAPQPARFCPQCGATAPATGAFCMECGAKLTPLNS